MQKYTFDGILTINKLQNFIPELHVCNEVSWLLNVLSIPLHQQTFPIYLNMAEKMTRREALKMFGLAFGTAAMATSGVSVLASCTPKKKRLVFYFTATGNSLYVARELGGSDIISIPQALKKGELEYEADEIGFVQPVYGHMPPNIVKDFLKVAKLKADYFFAVLTYGNMRGASPEVWDEFASSCGYKFHYITTILMVDNWLHAFDMNEQMKIDKKIPEQLERIKNDLQKHANGMDEITDRDRQFTAGFLQWTGMNKEDGFKYEAGERFQIDMNECVACGICMEVCPRGNYELTNRGVVASGQCDYCLACIHACPQKAITFRPSKQWLLGPEPNPKARYLNPEVSLNDIKRSNRQ